MMMYAGNGGGKCYLRAYQRGRQMVYRQPAADTFFGIIFHFQHKQTAAPFCIPCECKGGVNRMYVAAVEAGAVFCTDYAAEMPGITRLKEMLHKQIALDVEKEGMF